MHTKSNINEGLMPDSGTHIARLESKLQKIKNKNLNGKINGKELISSLKEFNEIYMHDYLKKSDRSVTLMDNEYSGTIALNYIERKILPEQPVNGEETQTLLENDFLSKTVVLDKD
ncbi:hypothetical protein BpHYR1_008137 [Brachionus plicatilis]|uniref:Uncharacterized protein n=1 Tax=Brachionus plicatilis TaxID=10195 RepID=A0A3M7P2C3_BRAPC|nr:hypothetical protein BpHYR1_008137 [Brachionus plicatilis]